MATSPTPGTPSSPSGAREHAIAALRALCAQPPLAPLISALGADAELHVVGGTVRDVLASLTPADLDLATKLSASEVSARLTSAGIRTIETGIAHGTLTALVERTPIEITTFRKPGVRTQHEFAETVEEDLGGRDFTINAVAYAIARETLIDPYDGVSHLLSNELVAVGDAATRFQEDPLRILRMLRFGPAAERRVRRETRDAARALAALLGQVSVERIQHELVRILLGGAAGAALREALELGILAHILPEVLPSVDFPQNEFHTEDVFEHTLTVVDRAERTRAVRLAALFHDLGKPASLSIGEDGRRHFYRHEVLSAEIARRVMERLRFSREETSQVQQLVALHMRPIECGPAGARRLLRELEENFDAWRALKIADAPPRMEEQDFHTRLAAFDAMVARERNRTQGSVFEKLAVNGDDILALGVPAGPQVGKLLRALQDEVIEHPEHNERERLLTLAKQLAASE